MFRHCTVFAPLVATGLLLANGAALAEPQIGKATKTKNQVQGIIDGSPRSLPSGSEIFSNELVQTGDGSLARLVFLDNTDLAVGPKSEVRLDKFIYDPTGTAGGVVLQVGRGAFRFVTGTQDHRNYSINTPYATLGVPGTVFELVVTPEKVDVHLNDGGLEVRSLLNQTFELKCEKRARPDEACGLNSMSIASDGTVSGPFAAPPNATILPFDVAALAGPADTTGSIGLAGGALGGATNQSPSGHSGGGGGGSNNAAHTSSPTLATGPATPGFTTSPGGGIGLPVSP